MSEPACREREAQGQHCAEENRQACPLGLGSARRLAHLEQAIFISFHLVGKSPDLRHQFQALIVAQRFARRSMPLVAAQSDEVLHHSPFCGYELHQAIEILLLAGIAGGDNSSGAKMFVCTPNSRAELEDIILNAGRRVTSTAPLRLLEPGAPPFQFSKDLVGMDNPNIGFNQRPNNFVLENANCQQDRQGQTIAD